MKFDSISKRTAFALGISFLAHFLFLVFLFQEGRVIQVPLSSDQINTRMGFAPAPKSSVSKKTLPKPKTRQSERAKVSKTQAPAKQAGEMSGPQEGQAKESGGSPRALDPDTLEKYINQVVRKIDRKKYYPRLAKENGEEGTVRIKITLGKTGNLLGYQVLQGTAYSRLKRATQQTVQAAAPFPPLPAGYGKSKLSIEVPVRFRLARSP